MLVCQKPAETGWIAVNSEPQSATVYLDDSLTNDVTNCVLEDVPVGEHAIKLTLEGYIDWDTLLEVEAGDTGDVYAVLIPDTLPDDTNETDTLLWRYKFDGYHNLNGGLALGSNGTIYVTADNNLYAINPDGTLKWRYESDSSYITIFAVGPEGNIYCSEGRCFCAFNPDGNLRWRLSEYSASYCAVAKDGTVYSLDKDSLRAFSSDGYLEWEYDTEPESDAHASIGLIIGGSETVYILTWNGLISLIPEGVLQWVCPEAAQPQAIDVEGAILCAGGNVVRAIGNNGQSKWEYEIDCIIRTSIVIGEDGTIYFGVGESYAKRGYLYAIGETGEFKWRYEAEETGWVRSPAIGSNGVIYFGGPPCYLYALNSDGSLKWIYDAGSAIMSPISIASDGTVYFCTAYHLYAVTSDSRGLANSSWPKYQHDNQCTGCLQ